MAAAEAAIRDRGRFLLVLAGGRRPKPPIPCCPRPIGRRRSSGRRFSCFWATNGWCRPAIRPATSAWPSAVCWACVPIPADQIFPVRTAGRSAAEAAAEYDADLRRFFAADSGNAPRFDLILLGMGEDGHTASLFPHAAALDVDNAWATWSPPGVLPPPVDRVTLTYPAINSARQAVLPSRAKKKAPALREILERQAKPSGAAGGGSAAC